MGEIGSNLENEIKELTAKYVACDEKSALLSDERKKIRDRIEELGHDTKAFQDKISRLKKDRKKKDGYDESYKVLSTIIDNMDTDDLFAWQDRREAEKEAAKEARKKERDEARAKADSYKSAPERKPKNSKSLEQTLAEAHPVVQ